MYGIDTNVLIRYLVQDDPRQGRAASRFVRSSCTPESPAFLNRIVLCETVWVLETAYGYARDQIAEVLERILRTIQFRVEDPSETWSALSGYRRGVADFADVLLARTNARSGCKETVTFDRKAARFPGFRAL